MEKNIISTQEISTEPVKKKRRTIFEFIKEQQLQLEEDANFSPVKTEFDLFFKEMVVKRKMYLVGGMKINSDIQIYFNL